MKTVAKARRDLVQLTRAELQSTIVGRRDWYLAGGKRTRRIRYRFIDSVDCSGDEIVIKLHRHTFRVTGCTIHQRDALNVYLEGTVERTGNGQTEAPQLREGLLILRSYDESLRRKAKVMARRQAVEAETTARETILRQQAASQQNVDRPLKDDDGNAIAARQITFVGLADMLNKGGWNVGAGRLAKSTGFGLRKGAIESARVEGGALVLTTPRGETVVTDCNAILHSPDTVTLRCFTYEKHQRPRNVGGGKRLIPVDCTVLYLHNRTMWNEMHPKTIAKSEAEYAELRRRDEARRAREAAKVKKAG